MKICTVLLSAGLASALVAGSFAGAHAGHEGLHARLAKFLHGDANVAQSVETHLESIASELELTAQQRADAAAALRTRLPDLETRIQALVDAHAVQCDLVHAKTFDEEAIRAASAKVGAAQTELAVAAARLFDQVHAVLSPEQLERLEASPHSALRGLAREEFRAQITAHVQAAGRGVEAWAARQ